ncbi:MAG: hypothetical protein ACYTXY_55265, partial [Nostoc sp.]
FLNWGSLWLAIALIYLVFAGQRADCKISCKLLPSKDSENLVVLEKVLKAFLFGSSKNNFVLLALDWLIRCNLSWINSELRRR